MSDIDTLEREIRTAIDAAADEAGIEAVRVAALGKKGSVSELLKSLGGMSPDERKTAGPALNGLRDRVSEALAARRSVLRDADLLRRLNEEAADVTLPVRQEPLAAGRIHPVSQV